MKTATKKIGVALALLSCINASAQTTISPIAPALGFNVFLSNRLILTTGDTHGAIACGGDVVINGNTTIAQNSALTYTGAPTANTYGLVVNGKVQYKSANSPAYVNQGQMLIGNLTGTTLYDHDPNNASTNLQVTSGTYNSNTRIQEQQYQAASTVSAANGINFTTAFATLTTNAAMINNYATASSCSASINYITTLNTAANSSNPTVTLVANKINYINLSYDNLTNLNNLGSINFSPTPDATHMVIFNVQPNTSTSSRIYSWTPPTLGGVSSSTAGSYTLWNFYGTDSLNINGGSSVFGSILAPITNISKTGGNDNYGQVIAKSLDMGFGEIVEGNYAGQIPNCTSGSTTTIGYVPPPTSLPVADIRLSGAAANDEAQLTWMVLNETHVKDYVVESSSDGSHFTPANLLAAAGDAPMNKYSTPAAFSEAGNVTYYRIKAEDINGSTAYSNTVDVKRTGITSAVITPNPFTGIIHVSVLAPDATPVTIQLVNMTGSVSATATYETASGSINTALPVPAALPAGVYIIRISNASGSLSQTQRMVKD